MTVFRRTMGGRNRLQGHAGGSRSSIYWRGRYATPERPGIWIDAFPEAPSQMQVLRNMYEEFTETGEVSCVCFRGVLKDR